MFCICALPSPLVEPHQFLKASDLPSPRYYAGGVSSVYMWNEDSGFAACFVIKKGISRITRPMLQWSHTSYCGGSQWPPIQYQLIPCHPGSDRFEFLRLCPFSRADVESRGVACWDVSHSVKVEPQGDTSYTYRVSTTLILSASTVLDLHAHGKFDLAGTIKRETVDSAPLGDGHIVNIGRIIEKVETNLRNMIGEVRLRGRALIRQRQCSALLCAVLSTCRNTQA